MCKKNDCCIFVYFFFTTTRFVYFFFTTTRFVYFFFTATKIINPTIKITIISANNFEPARGDAPATTFASSFAEPDKDLDNCAIAADEGILSCI